MVLIEIDSNAAAHAAVAEEHRIFAEYISSFLRHACVVINNVVETDLNMPQVRVQVQLVTQSLNLLIPDLKSRMEEAENYTNRQSEAMQGAAGGGFTGLEMQQTVAEGCRSDNENSMNLTVMGIALSVYNDRAAYANRRVQAGAFLDELAFSEGLDMFGARVSFTNVNRTTIIHGINFETPEVLLNSYGFLSQNQQHKITSDVLHNIVLNLVTYTAVTSTRLVRHRFSQALYIIVFLIEMIDEILRKAFNPDYEMDLTGIQNRWIAEGRARVYVPPNRDETRPGIEFFG